MIEPAHYRRLYSIIRCTHLHVEFNWGRSIKTQSWFIHFLFWLGGYLTHYATCSGDTKHREQLGKGVSARSMSCQCRNIQLHHRYHTDLYLATPHRRQQPQMDQRRSRYFEAFWNFSTRTTRSARTARTAKAARTGRTARTPLRKLNIVHVSLLC